MRNHIRIVGLAALLVIAAASAHAQIRPERTTAAGFPVVRSEEVKPKLLQAAALTGDLDRMVARVQASRRIVEAVVQQANPEALPKLAPALDEYFGAAAVRERVVEGFGRSINEDHPAEILAWAGSPDMVEINAAVRDFDFSRDGGQVSPDRHALLARLATAMVLSDFVASQTWDAEQLAAMTMDAIDPDAGAVAALRTHDSGVQPPSLDLLVEKWLAPALEKQSDAALAKFLAFAEGEAGRRYFSAFFVSGTVQANPVYEALPALVAAKAAREQTLVGNPQELADRAEHLLFEVGTYVVNDEARQLLRQAERAAPRDARIKSLLGHVELATRQGPRANDGEVRAPYPVPQFFEPAEAYWRAALEIDPDHAEALYGMGFSAFLKHDNAKAREYYERVAKVQPDHPRLPSAYADLALVEGRFDEAIAAYLEVLAAPQRRAYVHHFALENARIAYRAAGRPRDFTQLGYAHLAKFPDSRDFRFEFAEHLLEIGEPATKVLAVLEPVPEDWLPQRKIGIRVRAFALEAGESPSAEQRRRVLEEAGKLDGGIEGMIQMFCGQPGGLALAALASESSKQPAHASETLGCAVLMNEPRYVERMVVAGADVDAPVTIMQQTPLGIAFFRNNAEMFETLLRHGADPLRGTRDGRTIAELLENKTGPVAEKMRAALAAGARAGKP